MNKFFLAIAIAGAALFAHATNPIYVSGEVLVKFKSGKPTNLPSGASVKKAWPQIGLHLIKLPSSMTVAQAVTLFKKRSDVAYAEAELIRSYTATVNDPLVPQEYHLAKIKANQAWDLGTGDPTVIVAVLDSGFQLDHVDMAGKFVAGFDFMDNDTNPTWVSEPHGVETAGCVAAATNNATGIASIGFNCKVMPIRVGDAGIPTANSISGMIWAADHGAKVINMSYGGFGNQQGEKDASDYAWNHGCVVIAAAGNHGTTEIAYPAGYPKVIPVAATDQNDQRASFSAFGPWVPVAAPGVGVVTTQPGNGYGGADGTSFSSPITAGLAGLLFSLSPNTLTNIQVRDAIETTCDFVGTFVTKGRINAFKAMQKLVIATDPGVSINPDTITAVIGTAFVGDPASVSVSDDVYFQVGSVKLLQLGQAAGAEATFTIPVDKQNISINLESVGGIAGGTNMVWLWNWNAGQYVLIGSTPLAAAGNVSKTMIVPTASVPNYIGAGGAVKLLVRGHFPIKPFTSTVPNPFTYRIDLLQLLVR